MVKKLTVAPRIERGFKARGLTRREYAAVEEATAEKFGKDSRAYATVMDGVNHSNGTGSQFFFNTEAGLYLPEGKRVAQYDDLGRINDFDSEVFDGSFYIDTPQVVLRSKTLTYEKNNAQVLEHLVSQVQERELEFSTENPLLITGLGLRKDENGANHYGLLLDFTDETTAVNDERFAASKDTIEFGNSNRPLYAKQDGLSRVYLYGNGGVDSGDDDLQYSDDNGRVVVFDAEGVASEKAEFDAEMERHYATLKELRAKIDERLK